MLGARQALPHSSMGFVMTNTPKLFHFLRAIDEDLATQARALGCRHCGGVLHSARYPRKLGGVAAPADGATATRHSLCCETCRRRTTPASVCYFGRRVYPGWVVVLLSAMHSGVTDCRVDELRASLGVARRTLQRWRRWWRQTFSQTPFWEIQRGRFMPPLDPATLPGSMLERFLGCGAQAKLIQCLRFIAPLSVPGALTLWDGR